MNSVQVHLRVEKDLTERTSRQDEDVVEEDDDGETEAMVGKKRIPSPDQLRDYNYAVAGQ